MRRSPLHRIAASQSGRLGLALVGLIVACAALAPWLASHDPNAIDVLNRFAPPSAEHWMGTDHDWFHCFCNLCR